MILVPFAIAIMAYPSWVVTSLILWQFICLVRLIRQRDRSQFNTKSKRCMYHPKYKCNCYFAGFIGSRWPIGTTIYNIYIRVIGSRSGRIGDAQVFFSDLVYIMFMACKKGCRECGTCKTAMIYGYMFVQCFFFVVRERV